jgi:2-(3-amino-3-carboxypropyl)histidine synthase
MAEYDFEIEKVISSVKRSKAKRVGLQFPEGLKDRAIAIASEIEDKTHSTVIVMADPTYGACDLKRDACAKLGLDMLVHFGHTSFD